MYDAQFRRKKKQNPFITFAKLDSELRLIFMRQEPRQLHVKCYYFKYMGFCQRTNCFNKHQCLHCDKYHPASKCFTKINHVTSRFAGIQWTAESLIIKVKENHT